MSKKKMKAVIILAAITAVIALTVCISVGIHEMKYQISGMWQYEVQDFSAYKDDLKTVADTALKAYYGEAEKNKELSYVTVNMAEGEWCFSCTDSKGNYTVNAPAGEKEIVAFENTFDAFRRGESGLLSITAKEGEVVFTNSAGMYRVVYSESGNPPKGENVFVDRISGKWYQIMNTR